MTSARRSSGRRVPDERGSAATELVLLTPVVVALVLFVVALGRFAAVRSDVDEAARDAARAASLARNPVAARTDAERAARASLGTGGVTCRTMTLRLDLAAFRPGGDVAADVACVVDLADVSLPRFPGAKTFSATSVSVVDKFRSLR